MTDDYLSTMRARAAAHKRISSEGHNISSVWRVYSAGESDIFIKGAAREAVLCLNAEGECVTAVFVDDGVLIIHGW
jgi:hypothetical protein